MTCIEISPNIYWNGLNDRTSDLFEGLWPITQEGVTYNSYIINDNKVALIDLVKGIKTDEFLTQIEEVVDPAKVDYIVINHMEPDHTGMIKTMQKVAPRVTFIGTKKTKKMLEDYYQLDMNFQEVKSGDEISLGHQTLVFYETPFVHWPETMVTYEKTSKILFSCDAFGSYGAFTGSIFDDEYEDRAFYIKEALRYDSNIVAKFSRFVLKAIDLLKELEIRIIAPSHGLVWRNPTEIVDLYKKWAEYGSQPSEKGITLLYGSMYGNTAKIMESVAQGVSKIGLPIQIFDVARTHVSYILPYLWKYRGILIGVPTYETKLFPPMAYVLKMAEYKRIQHKKVARFGSFGWSGGAQRDLESRLMKLKWDFWDVFEFQGGPTAEDLKKGEEFGMKFADLIRTQDD
ncbi:MAG: FprA family A-type flavoprotein [Candidatus Hermodarchaeota archaeon]